MSSAAHITLVCSLMMGPTFAEATAHADKEVFNWGKGFCTPSESEGDIQIVRWSDHSGRNGSGRDYLMCVDDGWVWLGNFASFEYSRRYSNLWVEHLAKPNSDGFAF